MDLDWNARPEIGDWLRGPGDRKEIDAAIEKFGIDVVSPRSALEMAAAASQVRDGDEETGTARARLLLWVAGSLGSRKAGFMLAEEIRAFVRSHAIPDSAAAYYEGIAEKWDQHAERDEAEAAWGLAAMLGKRISAAARPAEAQPEEGIVVVPRVGDPTTAEGAALLKRYAACVGVRLPYRSSMPRPGEMAAAIAAEWPWAAHVGAHIEGALDVQRSVSLKRPTMKPMLFVGPPGSGKTALARRVATLLGHPPVVVPAGGASDSAGLAAVTRGWTSARPCGPVIAAADMGCCDPAIIVDEIDKTPDASNRNGSAAGVLLGMLGTPSAFQDACLMADVDLSGMFFMATANDIGSVHGALRDRFSVIVVGRPRPEHFDTVLANMRREAAQRLGVRPAMLPALDRDEYEALRSYFASAEGSLRDAARAFDFALSEAVRREAVERQAAPRLHS